MKTTEIPPFHIIGNIYYVGTRGVSSHLFADKAGHILIDACWPDSGQAILGGVRALGFNPREIKYLLISHAHVDHLGSAAFLVKETGAQVCVGEADIRAAQEGSATQPGLMGFTPFKVDVALHEGDSIAVGGTAVRVYHTPGHTPGCCSFGFEVSEECRVYSGMLFGGPGINVFAKTDPKRREYGGALPDFIGSVKRLLAMNPEVWLGAHPNQNATFEKHERLRKGEKPNPFIDPQGWKTYLSERLAAARKLEAR